MSIRISQSLAYTLFDTELVQDVVQGLAQRYGIAAFCKKDKRHCRKKKKKKNKRFVPSTVGASWGNIRATVRSSGTSAVLLTARPKISFFFSFSYFFSFPLLMYPQCVDF